MKLLTAAVTIADTIAAIIALDVIGLPSAIKNKVNPQVGWFRAKEPKYRQLLKLPLRSPPRPSRPGRRRGRRVKPGGEPPRKHPVAHVLANQRGRLLLEFGVQRVVGGVCEF